MIEKRMPREMSPREISIEGTRIAYVESGAGHDILYVHGNTGSKRWFERVMEVPDCRTVALDMPNFGGSAALTGDPDIDRYADFVVAFIKVLKIEKPVLVGHSLGGAVAISTAVRTPGLLRGLVLVDSAAPSGLHTPPERYAAIEAMRTRRGILSAALGAVVPTLTDKAFFQALVDDAARMAPSAWIGNARALSRFDCRGKCSAFPRPVLVIWGKKDVIVTEDMAQETAQAFPTARLVKLDHVGHSVVVEDPQGFLRLLSDFVSEIGKGD